MTYLLLVAVCCQPGLADAIQGSAPGALLYFHDSSQKPLKFGSGLRSALTKDIADAIIPFRHPQAGLSLGYSLSSITTLRQVPDGIFESAYRSRIFYYLDFRPIRLLSIEIGGSWSGLSHSELQLASNIGSNRYSKFQNTDLRQYDIALRAVLPISFLYNGQSFFNCSRGFFISAGIARSWIYLSYKYSMQIPTDSTLFDEEMVDGKEKMRVWEPRIGFFIRSPAIFAKRMSFEIGLDYCQLLSMDLTASGFRNPISNNEPYKIVYDQASVSQKIPVRVQVKALILAGKIWRDK